MVKSNKNFHSFDTKSKGGAMSDRKFKIAVFIIFVLAVTLLYITILGPQMQKFFEEKQFEAQKATVNAIVQIVQTSGSVVLGEGENAIVLVDQRNCEAIINAANQQQE